jgi:hypothetical protein
MLLAAEQKDHPEWKIWNFTLALLSICSIHYLAGEESIKIILQKSNYDKVKIQNLATNSQQFVSRDKLRPSQLPQFSVKGSKH